MPEKQFTPDGVLTAKQYARGLIEAGKSEDIIRMSLLSIFGDDSAYDDLTIKR